MKIIIIGDIHGENIWKKIIKKELKSSNKIVFLGDYFDSLNEDLDQIGNFNEIIQLKELYPKKIQLLIGNHEFHYMKGVRESYSGYQNKKNFDIQSVIHSAFDKGLMNVCFQYKDIICSHAGITKTWCKIHNIKTNKSLVKNINKLFISNYNLNFNFNGFNRYGDDITQSPIWVRPNSLVKDSINNYTQIVGHTGFKNITNIAENYYFIDTLRESGQYLSINIINNKKEINIKESNTLL